MTSVTIPHHTVTSHQVVFPALGESESSELFNDEPIVGVELSRPQNRVRPPKMIALGATKESITWQLSELDPKIGIEKYQVLITVNTCCLFGQDSKYSSKKLLAGCVPNKA